MCTVSDVIYTFITYVYVLPAHKAYYLLFYLQKS